MKNIHILSTDKPSWLAMDTTKNKLYFSPSLQHKTCNFLPQNIYITSNEEIKEGDYCISHLNIIDEGKIHNSQTVFNPKTKENLILLKSCKKIILTTDQDLINDGVQSIGDEFLEWFVNNSSCEEVEVELKTKQLVKPYDVYNEIVSYYKIIIPKEEPKQEIIEEVSKDFYPNENELMERIAFKRGYTECKERMYSKEEVYHILCEHTAFLFAGGKSTLTDWFKKFKKK